MIQVIDATFDDGVFKPNDPLSLPSNSRVRLHVEILEDGTEETHGREAWVALEKLWSESAFDSHGDRLTRDQLHERR